MVTLNRIVAVAMVDGPGAGLAELTAAEADPALAGHHRLHAVRAHLLDLLGDRAAARRYYLLAARRRSASRSSVSCDCAQPSGPDPAGHRAAHTPGRRPASGAEQRRIGRKGRKADAGNRKMKQF